MTFWQDARKRFDHANEIRDGYNTAAIEFDCLCKIGEALDRIAFAQEISAGLRSRMDHALSREIEEARPMPRSAGRR